MNVLSLAIKPVGRIVELCCAFAAIAFIGCETNTANPAHRLSQMTPSTFFDRSEMQDLLAAIKAGDLVSMDRAIQNGADVNGVGNEAMTPLMWALATESVDGFRHSLKRGGDVFQKAYGPRPGQSPFEEQPSIAEVVTGMKDTAYLKAMLDAGVDPNSECSATNGFLLHKAVWAHSRQAVELLVVGGADVNRQNREGTTPFLLAIQLDCDLALYLFDKGGDPTVSDSFGKSGLDIVNDPKLMPETQYRRCFDELKRVLNERGGQ